MCIKTYCVYSSDPCILEGNQDSSLCRCYIFSPDNLLGRVNYNHCQNIRVFYILKRSFFKVLSLSLAHIQIKCFNLKWKTLLFLFGFFLLGSSVSNERPFFKFFGFFLLLLGFFRFLIILNLGFSISNVYVFCKA